MCRRFFQPDKVVAASSTNSTGETIFDNENSCSERFRMIASKPKRTGSWDFDNRSNLIRLWIVIDRNHALEDIRVSEQLYCFCSDQYYSIRIVKRLFITGDELKSEYVEQRTIRFQQSATFNRFVLQSGDMSHSQSVFLHKLLLREDIA